MNQLVNIQLAFTHIPDMVFEPLDKGKPNYDQSGLPKDPFFEVETSGLAWTR